MLREIFFRALRQMVRLPVINANPELRIGPMRGEISMAPMITGALLTMSPDRAMRLARLSRRKYPADISTS